ncbi:hypothetical protein KI387_027865 [Taxus chinensis]|uniref:Serine carboxypeptidase n=1 Tax=Taxus chinensis TaxID=29808 RepID=A0AA38L9A4_TAXCH|nr:hypothetical protein KI387_027865 [Taxus chinensis]
MCPNKSIQDAFLCIVGITMLAGSVQLANGAPENARVESFPGYNGTLHSKIYTGIQMRLDASPIKLWQDRNPMAMAYEPKGFLCLMVHSNDGRQGLIRLAEAQIPNDEDYFQLAALSGTTLHEKQDGEKKGDNNQLASPNITTIGESLGVFNKCLMLHTMTLPYGKHPKGYSINNKESKDDGYTRKREKLVADPTFRILRYSVQRYVTISEAHGRALFYYFVESERNPTKDPVLLWLTGGPGCSSFTGFVYELGPMYFDLNNYSGGLPRLIDNPHSWTKVCNIIFLDSPAGTGFSYSNTTEDYVFGDYKIVSDIYTFLIKWFEAYPEFQSNPIYIGGDSYSGIVVPILAQKIADGIAAGVKPTLNLKGYLVGNGMTDNMFDSAQIPFAHGMALISDELYKETKEACNGKYSSPTNFACLSKLWSIWQGFYELNTANILDASCFPITMKQESIHGQKNPAKRYEKSEVFDQLHEARRRMFSHGWFTRFISQDGYLPIPLQLGYQDRPCPSLDKYHLSYIWAKNPFVREAVHCPFDHLLPSSMVKLEVLEHVKGEIRFAVEPDFHEEQKHGLELSNVLLENENKNENPVAKSELIKEFELKKKQSKILISLQASKMMKKVFLIAPFMS